MMEIFVKRGNFAKNYDMKRALFLLLTIIVATTQMNGKIVLPSLISDNMVLQQKSDVKLWGWGDPQEEIKITASWSKKIYNVQTDNSGKWSIHIRTPKSRSGEKLVFTSGKSGERIEINNILIGEVWLASGQSNMEFEMKPHPNDKWMTGMYNWEEEAANAQYPNIHLFKVEEDWEHGAPREDCKGEWVVCSPEVAKGYSAIAFLFARELHTTLDLPVGVILCAYGGTHAESWIRDEIMRKDTIYNRVFKNYTPEKMAPKGYQHKVPSAIWNAMVNPIAGYTIKGNIWYQAESNSYRAEDYAEIFTDLVNDWRQLWGQKRLPFYYMQVAPYDALPGDIRLEQAKVWEEDMLEDIFMATTIDIGDSLDVHPKEKVLPAKRFAALALANEYGKKIECYGPVFKEMKRDSDKLIISFQHGEGLYIKNGIGEKSHSGANYLLIAGEDGIYYPALSRVEGDKLILWSPDVQTPAHVKYCTEDYCKGNIYNGAGLPAYPFKQ